MKQLCCVFALATAVSFVHSSFALDAAYWLGGSSNWGLFGTAENWAIGSAESGTHAVPGTGHSIVLDKNMKFDLDGTTQAVGGLTGTGSGGNASYLMSFTNGMFTVDGILANCVRFEAWNGATVVVKGKTARFWGAACSTDTVIVHAGGRYEERGKLQFQGYRVKVEAGGTVVHDPTSYGPHPSLGTAQDCHVYGRYEAPNGLKRFKEWDTTYSTPRTGSVTYFVHDGGTLLLGGEVSRNMQVQIPFNLKFEDGCTLIASNAVTFAANMDLVKVMEDAAVTMEVVKDATLNLANVTVGEGASVTKTGAGILVLGSSVLPMLAVDAGSVEVGLGAALPTACAFAAGSTLSLKTTRVELNPVAYEGMAFSVDGTLLAAGAVLLMSDDAAFLSYARNQIATRLPAGYGVLVRDGELVVGKDSAYVFDPTKTSDLSDPKGWIGDMPTAADDVLVSGAGTAAFTPSTTKFKSITLQLGATLAVSGGTEADPVDIPPVELDYDARLLVSDCAVLTNALTTIGDAQTLPVLEVATNAVLTVQTPGPQPLKSMFDHWSWHFDDYGFRLKNAKLRWYGTIKSAIRDLRLERKQASLYLGYAAAGETSYIAVDCRGGTWLASCEWNDSSHARTPLIVATPDAGGSVVPVGTLLFRDYRREVQPAMAAGKSEEYHWSGIFIGKANPWYTGNPADIGYDVVFEGAGTQLDVQGYNRIAGGAHVTFRGGATWKYGGNAFNDSEMPRSVVLYDKATLAAEDGAAFDFSPTKTTNDGASGIVIREAKHAAGEEVFAARRATFSTLTWGGASPGIAVIDGAKLVIGSDRDRLGVEEEVNTGVFANLSAARLDGGLTVAAADLWHGRHQLREFEWNRHVTVVPPLTGAGGLTVTNELPAALGQWGMTVLVTNGQNAATGVAQACETQTGPAALVFADGANWAGTVVANGRVSLTNLLGVAHPAEVTFGALRFEGPFPIRVWKTDCAIAANDKVNLLSPIVGSAQFAPVAMDEPLVPGDCIDLGLYPAGVPLPKNAAQIRFSSSPSGVEGFVLLVATCCKPGFIFTIGDSPSAAPATRIFSLAETEVVIAPNAPASVVFAATEMTNFLSQAAGREVPLLRAPGSATHRLFLGANGWSEAAGVSIDGLARDGYGILVKDGDVYIAGTDDPAVDPAARIRTPSWGAHKFDHGTLNGVYAFLEESVGVRFYFPGELGTCVSKTGVVKVRDGWRVAEPDMTVRTWSQYSDGEWFEGDDPNREVNPVKTVNLFRQRASTREYGCCHGLNGFHYVERFGTTHPEYFALDANGSRMIEGEGWRRGHLCLSSGIRDEIFKDCLSYCKGEDASVRGIPGPYAGTSWGKKYDWNSNVSPLYIDLMPQDGNAVCYCAECQAKMRPADRPARSTELVWGLLAEVAARLKAEGYEPTLTMMSYADYADLPDVDLPDNLRVMVAKTGPWANPMPGNIEGDADYLARWEERLGRKTWMWTYPNRNDGNCLDIAGVPAWAPRAWARYYQGVAPHVFGLFAESETDRAIDNLMGYYLLARIGWNRSVDTRAILSEFYVRMFGAAAAEMKAALEMVEDKFTLRVAGAMRETEIGPQADIPSEYRLWTEIYSAEEMARLGSCFDAAAAKTVPGSVKARRVALFRKWMYEPPKAAGDAYRAILNVPNALEYHAAREADNLVNATSWQYGTPDADERVYSAASQRVTTTAEDTAYWYLNAKLRTGVRLERGATYRLSWFVKTDLEPTQKGGGATMRVNMTDSEGKFVQRTFPEHLNYLSGQVGWIHQSVDFTVPEDFASDVEATVNPFVRYAIGRAWFDGALLEKVDKSK